MRSVPRSATAKPGQAAASSCCGSRTSTRLCSRSEFVEAIFQDLAWLGVDWAAPPIIQSQRTAAYDEALDKLKSRGLAFACFCTRADIAQSLTAPHGDAASGYPGACRGLPDDPERRAGTPHCWRLDSAKALEIAGIPTWTETDGTHFTATPEQIGDAILARKDAPASYHLACVVDDAAAGVTTVVRGADLRPSTPTQRLLQTLLGLPEPAYLHHALVTHEGGQRLAKRDQAPTRGDAGARRGWPPTRRRAPCRAPAVWLSYPGSLRASMRFPLLVLLLLAMAATAYVLVRGVIAMASGKDITGEQQQKYMQRRVLYQGIAIVIVILILVLAGQSSH